MRLSIGHDHLRTGRAVQHGAAVEAHVVQHEALLRIDGRAHRPAVPAHLVALDREAHAIRLGDRERPQVVAQRDDAGGEIAIGVRNRLDVQLLELEHAALVEVHVGDQALDRMGVAVLGLVPAQVRRRAGDPPPPLHLELEAARCEHVDLHERDIGDTATRQRLAPPGVGPHGVDGGLVILGRDG